MSAAPLHRRVLYLLGTLASSWACTQVPASPIAGTPFDLRGVLESGSSVTSKVRATQGATLTATAGDGTVYRLTIPPRALPIDTLITITPLTQISGVPGQTRHYGVDISPAGTRLLEFAKLEVIPKSELAKPTYWLEHKGPPHQLAGRPAFPLRKGSGMLLSHFSGGSVLSGSPETTRAMHPETASGVTDRNGSTSWLEWQRNIVEQDYQQGRIDQITHDTKMAIIVDRLRESTTSDLVDQLTRAQEHAREMSGESDGIAARGRLADLDALSERLAAGINADRLAQFIGLPSTFNPLKPLVTYVAAVVSKCGTQPVPPKLLISLAKQSALLGAQISGQDLARCLCALPDKPADLCSESRGWIIKESGDYGGVHIETNATSCESEFGPWTVTKRVTGPTLDNVTSFGPVTLSRSGTTEGSLSLTSPGVAGTGSFFASISRDGDGFVLEITITGLQTRSTVGPGSGYSNAVVAQRYRIRPASSGECG